MGSIIVTRCSNCLQAPKPTVIWPLTWKFPKVEQLGVSAPEQALKSSSDGVWLTCWSWKSWNAHQHNKNELQAAADERVYSCPKSPRLLYHNLHKMVSGEPHQNVHLLVDGVVGRRSLTGRSYHPLSPLPGYQHLLSLSLCPRTGATRRWSRFYNFVHFKLNVIFKTWWSLREVQSFKSNHVRE